MKKAKALSIFIAALAFCGLFAFAKVDVSAAAMLPEEADLAYVSTDCSIVSIQVTQGEAYTEVQLCDVNGNPIASQICTSYAKFTGLTSKNHVYGYRARRMASDQVTPTSDYSPIKYFHLAKLKLKDIKSSKAMIYLKLPKVAGVKKFNVYLSNKSDSGYKKIKSVKPGKKLKITKFKKKKLKSGHTYYCKVTATLANGETAEACFYNRIYIYTRYVYK